MTTNRSMTLLLDKIAELGGKGMKEEDIVYEGTLLRLPVKYQGHLELAIKDLTTKLKEENEPSDFSRTFKYRPWDGARNAFNALKKGFGLVSGKTIHTMFGDIRPEYIQVPTSVYETEEVPWGQFTLPGLENTTIVFGATRDPEMGQVFQMGVTTPRKNRFVVEGMFKMVEMELQQNSIYKGKAIDGAGMPNFIDLSGVHKDKVVYSKQVRADLEAHVWGFIQHSDWLINRRGMSGKRAILLHGTYGTGKSLTNNLTAQVATENGWTTVLVRPGKDDFFEALQTARLYQPAVLLFEDADVLASEGDATTLSKLLDAFDGITAKSTRLMVVMTTNHENKLDDGMRRPGRIDQKIHIGPLDREGVEQLVRIVLGDTCGEVNFDEVFDSCAGYAPAFIVEAATRAIRYADVRTNFTGDVLIETEDMVLAAVSLRDQYSWMQGGVDRPNRPAIEEALENAVSHGVARLVPAASEEPHSKVWNKDSIGLFQNQLN